jgi:diketogulonate reductase-like aldo/keto reductase
MKQIKLPDNKFVSALGQGTWHMGRDASLYEQESNALRYGMDLSMNLIDTAEMYHDAELVVARALRGRREEAFVVSKVLPGNASYKGTIDACERSLGRLGVECIDLYLLHWAGAHPIEETLEAFQRLVSQGKIARYGVSNLDIHEMEVAWSMPGGDRIATNQLYYNVMHRGIEWDLLPWCREKGMPIMAYSPLNQGRLDSAALEQVAMRHHTSPHQIALAWLLMQDDVIVIPKSARKHHIDQNYAALDIKLTDEDLVKIDQKCPPPDHATGLDII